jgi:hypothetical protein
MGWRGWMMYGWWWMGGGGRGDGVYGRAGGRRAEMIGDGSRTAVGTP